MEFNSIFVKNYKYAIAGIMPFRFATPLLPRYAAGTPRLTVPFLVIINWTKIIKELCFCRVTINILCIGSRLFRY